MQVSVMTFGDMWDKIFSLQFKKSYLIHCINVPQLFYLLIYWWALRLFPDLGHYKYHCCGILWSHKKGNLTLCNSMSAPGDYYAKWNNPVRERHIPCDLIYMSNLMNKINWWTKQREAWKQNRLIAVREEGWGED